MHLARIKRTYLWSPIKLYLKVWRSFLHSCWWGRQKTLTRTTRTHKIRTILSGRPSNLTQFNRSHRDYRIAAAKSDPISQPTGRANPNGIQWWWWSSFSVWSFFASQSNPYTFMRNYRSFWICRAVILFFAKCDHFVHWKGSIRK